MISETKRPKVRLTWNMLYDCNYRCSYCFFEGKWEEYRRRNIYLSPDEWIEYWRRIYDKYGPPYLIITGGEPFIYPNFIEIIKELSKICYHINISSNSSGDLKRFVEEIDPQKVSLSISYQPEFDKLENFLERALFLRRHKFDGCLNFVSYPPYLKDIEYYKDSFTSIGESLSLKIIPFFGEYRGISYPQGYTQEEREFIGIDDNWFKRVRKKGSLCPAGRDTALIFPDGKVARCGQIGEDKLLGSFFDANFKLLEELSPCEAEFCPCDEWRVVPEEENKDAPELYKALPKVEEINRVRILNSPEDIQSNSSLNEEEYRSQKIVLESSPKVIFIQAAGPCNSYCVFCSRGSDYEKFNLEIHRSRFEEKLYPFIAKAEELILTGSGEFLFLPEAEAILDFFDNRFPEARKIFSTNSSTLTPQICERIAYGRSKYTIHLSLHASNSQLHKVLTRTENFHKIIEQIRYLLSLRKRTGNIEIRLIFVATTLNIEDLPDFIRLASELGVDRVICYYNYIYIPTQKYLSCFFKKDLTNEILLQSGELSKRLGMRADLPQRFDLKNYPTVGICREAWSQIMFTSEGHVLPCDASEDCNESLEDKNLMDIWNGAYYQILRKSLIERSASCFKYCLRANPSAVNDFRSHVIRRGRKVSEIDILWGDD